MGVAAALAAAVGLLIGSSAVKWYIWDIAIQQADESDRSMLFWGIPILFIGVAALAVGGALAFVARRKLRESMSPGD